MRFRPEFRRLLRRGGRELLDEAVKSKDDTERYALYGDAEARLTGANGAFPYIPLYWIVYPILHKANVIDWKPNLLDQFDWTKVRLGTNE